MKASQGGTNRPLYPSAGSSAVVNIKFTSFAPKFESLNPYKTLPVLSSVIYPNLSATQSSSSISSPSSSFSKLESDSQPKVLFSPFLSLLFRFSLRFFIPRFLIRYKNPYVPIPLSKLQKMVAGVTVRSHKLRPVRTKPADQCVESEAVEASSTTPTGKEARIDDRQLCPPAPRKRRSDKWNYGGGGGGVVREYFTVPDLESVFVIRRQVESAN